MFPDAAYNQRSHMSGPYRFASVAKALRGAPEAIGRAVTTSQ
jgi:hypothetical protein